VFIFCFFVVAYTVWFAFLLCIQFIMATRKDDSFQSISVQLDGKNYSFKSCYEKFLCGKSMYGYVSGVKAKRIDTNVDDYTTALKVWKIDNSKIITWVNNYVTRSIGKIWYYYRITYLDCIHSLILPSSINLRQIFMHWSKITWAFMTFILPWQSYGINLPWLNLHNWVFLHLLLLVGNHNVWFNSAS